MRVLISAEGEHEPAGHHYMVVDNHGLLVDLSNVLGALHDPTIRRVEWGQVQDGVQIRDGGTIIRQDGHRQLFFDLKALDPYLAAYKAKLDELTAAKIAPVAAIVAAETP